MVLMQSSGRYDIHCNMFRSERAASASFARASIDTAASDGSHGISTTLFKRALVSMIPPVGVWIAIIAQHASSDLFGNALRSNLKCACYVRCHTVARAYQGYPRRIARKKYRREHCVYRPKSFDRAASENLTFALARDLRAGGTRDGGGTQRSGNSGAPCLLSDAKLHLAGDPDQGEAQFGGRNDRP